MATYEYRCTRHREFTVSFPIGEATAATPCPVCGTDAARVFSAPALNRTPRRLATAIDAAVRSAEAPEVVSAVPQRRRRRRPANPAHARLPRP
ncbi:MAG TPA: zinc ribbon domain-containing protein [Natronosporangium sp.]|nr:zinc ribbon domain-containing protein [Natronosporangium sp.]